MTATSRLYRFKPVTPLAPIMLNSHPPTIAPTTPRTISSRRPSPRLLTILLPMKPAIRPSTIHARNDKEHLQSELYSRLANIHEQMVPGKVAIDSCSTRRELPIVSLGIAPHLRSLLRAGRGCGLLRRTNLQSTRPFGP